MTGGGLGMRIVGGKVNSDGSLMASVIWVIPGGPADLAGVRQGDKVSSTHLLIIAFYLLG